MRKGEVHQRSEPVGKWNIPSVPYQFHHFSPQTLSIIDSPRVECKTIDQKRIEMQHREIFLWYHEENRSLDMETRYFETLDIHASLLGFGAMRFPTTPEDKIDRKRSLAMMKEAY